MHVVISEKTKAYRKQWYLDHKEQHYAKQKEYLARVGYNPKYTQKYKEINTVSYLYKMAKTRAKKKGLEFNIEKSDVIIPEMCPYFKVLLTTNSIGNNPWFPSIDRIDSTRGYIKGNIQVMSTLANRMKWNATPKQLLQFAIGVVEKAGLGLC